MCDPWLHGCGAFCPRLVIAPNLADASDSFDVHRHRQTERFCAVHSRRLARELGSDGCWSADKPAAAVAEAIINQTRRVFCSSSSRCTVDCNVAWASSCVHWCVTPPSLHCTALLLSRVGGAENAGPENGGPPENAANRWSSIRWADTMSRQERRQSRV